MDLFINLVIATFVLIALYVTIYYLHRVNKSYRGILVSIDKVSKELISLHNNQGNEDFLPQANNIFGNYPNLLESWKNYKKRLDNNGKYALVHSREFFSREKLISLNTKNRDRIKALPGLLTAWGLLGTFVAILLGLTGIDPNNITTINNLVHGLYAKFSSSIVALGCSIYFVFLERGTYSKLGTSCNNLQQILEELFPTLSSNEILSNMEYNMGLQMDTMNSLSQSLAQNSLESIQTMVNMFRDTLTEGTAQQFKDITETINNLGNMVKELQETQNMFLNRMEIMNSNSETLLGQHKELLDSFSKTLNKIKDKVGMFEEAIDKSKEAYKSLSEVTGEIAYASEQFVSIAPALGENNASIKQLTQNLNECVEYFDNVTNEIAASKLDIVIHQFKEGIQTSLTDIQNGLNEDLSIIKEGYEWHDKQLNKLIETATENIDKIHSSMNDYTEKTSNFLANYDESIAKAISYLNTNIHTMDNSLKDNIKTLENNFSDLNKTLENINNGV